MPRFATTVITPALGACTTARGGRIDLITRWAPPEPADDFGAFITPDPRLLGTKRGELTRGGRVCIGAPIAEPPLTAD